MPVALSSTSGRTGRSAAHAPPMGQAPRADSELVRAREPSRVFPQGEIPFLPLHRTSKP
jgi:hypothetical protein